MEIFLKLEELLRYLEHNPSDIAWLLGACALVLALAGWWAYGQRKYLVLIFKSLRRNVVRTALTSFGVMVFISQLSFLWSFLVALDVFMTEKSKDLKAIVTERWQIPSQMPYAYASTLEEAAARRPGDLKPQDSMTWQFYGGTTDPANRTRENTLFFFAMDPRKIRTMMDDLDSLDPAVVQKMLDNKQGILLGRDHLRNLKKRVGDRIRVTGWNYKGIDLDFEIVGQLPEGRYNMSGIMSRDYLNDALDAYPQTHQGAKHPLAERTLNLVWLRVPDTSAFNRVSGQIMSSSAYTAPAVKVETASSGIASWIEPYRSLLTGLKYFVVPGMLVIMVMIIALSISISVRERRTEVAVLKVLGYGPGRILMLILGEALVLGGGSGLVCGTLAYVTVHHVLGGINFRVAFFPIFDIFADAIWWGLVFGCLTALLGSIWPAWSARKIKVSEVFAKIA